MAEIEEKFHDKIEEVAKAQETVTDSLHASIEEVEGEIRSKRGSTHDDPEAKDAKEPATKVSGLSIQVPKNIQEEHEEPSGERDETAVDVKQSPLLRQLTKAVSLSNTPLFKIKGIGGA